MINRNIFQGVIEENLEYKLRKLLDDTQYGSNAIPLMFRIITLLYKQKSPEILRNKVRIALAPDVFDRSAYALITMEEALVSLVEGLALLAFDEFTFSVVCPEELEDSAFFQYVYNGSRNEQFIVRPAIVNVTPSADNVAASIFAIPTFKELEESLDTYYQLCAKFSQCYILKGIWKDDTYSSFKNKPEDIMQKSLYQYLHLTLRARIVSREKMVDDSHPVDIEIVWPTNTTAALIEIKWLGVSGTTKYADARANYGANQLIEYLNASQRKEPNQYFKGYLVVYDGRRHNLKPDYYRDREINYKREYLSDPRMVYRRLYLEQNCAISF